MSNRRRRVHANYFLIDRCPKSALFENTGTDTMSTYFSNGGSAATHERSDILFRSDCILLLVQRFLHLYEVQNPVRKRSGPNNIEEGWKFEMSVDIDEARHEDGVLDMAYSVTRMALEYIFGGTSSDYNPAAKYDSAVIYRQHIILQGEQFLRGDYHN